MFKRHQHTCGTVTNRPSGSSNFLSILYAAAAWTNFWVGLSMAITGNVVMAYLLLSVAGASLCLAWFWYDRNRPV